MWNPEGLFMFCEHRPDFAAPVATRRKPEPGTGPSGGSGVASNALFNLFEPLKFHWLSRAAGMLLPSSTPS
jgi:hypothetical protein